MATKNLTFKTKRIYAKSGKINFDSPFSQKCVIVMLADYSGDNNTISKLSIESFDVDGFIFHTSSNSDDTIFYLALGY